VQVPAVVVAILDKGDRGHHGRVIHALVVLRVLIYSGGRG
jgi:hypothetical protein